MRIKTAPESFRKNTFDYQMLERKGNIILYRQTKKTPQGMILHYEVHKVRVLAYPSCNKQQSIANTHYEKLPSNEGFGYYGWSFKTFENARDKFHELTR